MTKKRNTYVTVLKWTSIVLSSLLVLVLLATWIINRGPVQDRIRQAVSERAGEILTFERLRVALLPKPHLVLKNAVISVRETVSGLVPSAVIYPEFLELLVGRVRIETVGLDDPDFVVTLKEKPGAEEIEDPAAIFTETRAELEAVTEKVRRAAPEFSGRIYGGKLKIVRNRGTLAEITGIAAKITLVSRGFSIRMQADTARWGRISAQGGFLVLRHGFRLNGVSASGGRSSISGLNARFSWRRRPYLQITSGQASISLEDVYERRSLFGLLRDQLRDVKTMKGTVRFSELNFRGPLLHPRRWKLSAAGKLEKIVFSRSTFPRPVGIEGGSFTATAKTITLTGLRGVFMGSPLTGSVEVSGFPNIRSLELSLNGVIHAQTVDWLQKRFGPSPWLALRAPLSLSDFKIKWKKRELLSLNGRATAKNGPAVAITLDRTPKELRISRLAVNDGKMSARLSLAMNGDFLDLKFKGSLAGAAVEKVLERLPGGYGWIRGDAQARIRFDRPQESTAYGRLEGADLILPFRLPVVIRHLNIRADRNVLTLNSGLFDWADVRAEMKGSVTASNDGFALDLNAGTEKVNMDKLRQLLAGGEKGGKKAGGNLLEKIPLAGVVRFYAAEFVFEGHGIKPFRADALFMPDTVRLKLLTATLCGISVGGTIEPFGRKVKFDLVPVAVPQPLEPVLRCFGQTTRITGEFTMYSLLGTEPPAPVWNLMRSLYGHVEFSARDGRIYRYPLLSRILSFLSITELLRGKVPDLGREGFAYKRIKIKADILNGKMTLDEAYLEGASLNLVAQGEIDLTAKTINVTVLVAPFKTIEYILNKIPIIRSILANRLITVPVRVKGSLANPEVTALSPEAVGKNLLDIMKRIIALPFKVLNPLFGLEH